MKRNIVTTIEFSTGQIKMQVIEILSNNVVEIFSSSSPLKKSFAFLSESIDKVNKLIGGKIKDAIAIVSPSKKVNEKITLVKESLRIADDFVTKKDIDNLIELTKHKHTSETCETILVQPLQFEVKGELVKKYSSAPIHKKGETIAATMAITTIDPSVVNYIKSTIKSVDLKVSKILLKPQTISQNNLSTNALTEGSILINIGQNQSFVTINKNLGTIAQLSFYKSGYKQLKITVSKAFGCSYQDAQNLIAIYGSIAANDNSVIYLEQSGMKIIQHTVFELKKIIESFINKLLALSKKYLGQKSAFNLPIVFSGEITKMNCFEKIARQIFDETPISIYSPMTYIETREKSRSAIGLIHFNKRMDQVLDRQFNTVVETNPNTFSSLRKESKGLFAKIFLKLGGRNEWMN